MEEAGLQAILQAGRWAPTAKNQQEQKVYVIQSAEGLARIDALPPCRYHAATVLMVAFDRTRVYEYPDGRYDSGREEAAIVATHMLLAAKANGVESCWVNRFDPDEAARVFGLPDSEEVLMLLDLGYATAGAGPLENHTHRKPLEETVRYL